MSRLKITIIIAVVGLALFQTLPLRAKAMEVTTTGINNPVQISTLQRIVELLQQIYQLRIQLEKLQAEIISRETREIDVVPLPDVTRYVRIGEAFDFRQGETIGIYGQGSLRIANNGHVICLAGVVSIAPCSNSMSLNVYKYGYINESKNIIAEVNVPVEITSGLTITYRGNQYRVGDVVYPEFVIRYTSVVEDKNHEPVINGISGPTNLKVGERGTWKVTANDIDGDDLSYYVDWGDTMYVLHEQGDASASYVPTYSQDTTFSHTYDRARNFTVLFTVKDEHGKYTKTTITVNVTEDEQVNEIAVLYPNGGEVLYRGQSVNIKWNKYDEPVSIRLVNAYVCPDGAYCAMPLIYYPDWTLSDYVYSGNGYFTWEVGKGMVDDFHQSTYIPDGNYKVKVCGLTSNRCDLSDELFHLGTMYY